MKPLCAFAVKLNGISNEEISHMLAALKVSKPEQMLRQSVATLLWWLAFFVTWSPFLLCGVLYAAGFVAAFHALVVLVSINTLTWIVWGLRLKPNFGG